MRMIHFIDPRDMEKKHDWLWEVKARCTELRDKAQYCGRCAAASSTVWVKIKQRLLALIRRERL